MQTGVDLRAALNKQLGQRMIVFFDSEPQRRPDLDKIFIRVVAIVFGGCVRIGAVFEQQSCDIDMAVAGGDGQRVRIGLKII